MKCLYMMLYSVTDNGDVVCWLKKGGEEVSRIDDEHGRSQKVKKACRRPLIHMNLGRVSEIVYYRASLNKAFKSAIGDDHYRELVPVEKDICDITDVFQGSGYHEYICAVHVLEVSLDAIDPLGLDLKPFVFSDLEGLKPGEQYESDTDVIAQNCVLTLKQIFRDLKNLVTQQAVSPILATASLA